MSARKDKDMDSSGGGRCICIYGAPLNIGNLGVTALATALVKVILNADPQARLCFVMSGPTPQSRSLRILGREVEVEAMGHRLSPRARPSDQLPFLLLLSLLWRFSPRTLRTRIENYSRYIRLLSRADFVGDIWGGDSFTDLYGKGRLLQLWFPRLIPWVMGHRTILFPQTYGPFDSALGRSAGRFFLEGSLEILSRDREGMEVVKSLTKGKREALFCPDVAFALDSEAPEDSLGTFRPSGETIGFNVSGLLYSGGYNRDNMFHLNCDYRELVLRIAQTFLERTQAQLLLVPHTFDGGDLECDLGASRDLLSRLPEPQRERVGIQERHLGPTRLKGIIGGCDFFIGSRMHSCIAGLSQGIPTVGVAYSRKFKGVFQTVGVIEQVADARELDADQIMERIWQAYSDRVQIRETLAGRAQTVQAQILSTFVEIFAVPVEHRQCKAS